LVEVRILANPGVNLNSSLTIHHVMAQCLAISNFSAPAQQEHNSIRFCLTSTEEVISPSSTMSVIKEILMTVLMIFDESLSSIAVSHLSHCF
jgi:hypothetical protein